MNIAGVKRKRDVQHIEEVQSHADTRQIAINRVGVKHINHPVRLKDRSGHEQHSIANFNMFVNLSHDVKGTHMSRSRGDPAPRARTLGEIIPCVARRHDRAAQC